MKTLLSFHNDPEIKKKYLSRVLDHAKADEIIKGQYWENGEGCAVGCTVHGGSHSAYEEELGLPEWLAKLEDVLFEGLPIGQAKTFPARFLEAIPVGTNLETVRCHFCLFLLKENAARVRKLKIPSKLRHEVLAAIMQDKNIHEDAIRTGIFDESAAKSAAAWSAARLAWSAAWLVARAAESAAHSARAAESAAHSARAAWSAADSAMRSAADSARAAADSAESAARAAAYVRYANELLRLLATA